MVQAGEPGRLCPVCPREAEWVPAADGKMGSCGSWGGRPERRPPPPPQQQRNRLESTWGGCGPSVPGPPRGLRAIRSLAFFYFFWPGLWPRTNMYVLLDPSVDCPRGPGPGAQPRRFQNGIRSTALPRGGREGAGRGGGPASWAALRWALASSCLCCCECGEQ